MPGVLIFGGTTEGRELAKRYPRSLVCVTSAYARALLPADTDCRVGAMDAAAMENLIRQMRPERVIDATHPYAARATAAIRACCERLHVPYQRVARPVSPGAWRQYVRAVADTAAAVDALREAQGNILLTTGSHTAADYAAALDVSHLWVRVLPTREALALCADAGIPASHVIAMQGPFSEALNAALYDQLDIRVLVTKDSGKPGGVAEKVIPALKRDMEVILIERPKEEPCAENR
ncbi:MAG: precorrin-6A reductase [Clostridia bacterium]|nr:precorrin-6A reductase [Clostridia bacterium]